MENTFRWRWHGLASLLLLVVFGLASCSDDDDNSGNGAVTPNPSGNAREVAAWLGLGWNLGNSLDAHANGVASETAWDNAPATQALFTKVAEAGFTAVRIPVTWMGHIGAAPEYKIEDAWMNRVAEVVGYAENAGLKAIVNIHHDGYSDRSSTDYNDAMWLNIREAARNEAVKAEITAKFKAVWTQIAERFKDKGEFLIFESMNEVHDGDWGMGQNRLDGGAQYAVMNEWNQVFVDAVRAVGGENTNRFLGIPGYSTAADLTIDYLVLPTDPTPNRLMVAVHFYEPTAFTLTAEYDEWGHTAADGQYVIDGNEENIQDLMDKLKTNFVDKDIPVYLGEMGCVRHDSERSEQFRRYYLEYVCKAAREAGVVPFCWDNGYAGAGAEQSGMFDRATGEFLNDAETMVDAMVKAVFTTDGNYTLESVYNSAPTDAPVEEASVE